MLWDSNVHRKRRKIHWIDCEFRYTQIFRHWIHIPMWVYCLDEFCYIYFLILCLSFRKYFNSNFCFFKWMIRWSLYCVIRVIIEGNSIDKPIMVVFFLFEESYFVAELWKAMSDSCDDPWELFKYLWTLSDIYFYILIWLEV